jgi:metal-responsive CopG/Arc/MetJ family transcriptional regulator
MKAVQVVFDEVLLRRLAASPDVAALGRSEVVRRAVADYLARRERAEIAETYRNAYARKEDLSEEFEGWTEEGEWPER